MTLILLLNAAAFQSQTLYLEFLKDPPNYLQLGPEGQSKNDNNGWHQEMGEQGHGKHQHHTWHESTTEGNQKCHFTLGITRNYMVE